jgi:hypothetical protein
MVFPWNFVQGFTITVTALESDGFGGTWVSATFLDVSLKKFLLPEDWKVVGADALKASIVSVTISLIEDALELSDG